jgi:hypothetical protein
VFLKVSAKTALLMNGGKADLKRRNSLIRGKMKIDEDLEGRKKRE